MPACKQAVGCGVTRRSSGVAPRACVRVYARVLVPPNLYIHTYIATVYYSLQQCTVFATSSATYYHYYQLPVATATATAQAKAFCVLPQARLKAKAYLQLTAYSSQQLTESESSEDT